MVENKEIPNFKTYEDMAEFWDVHSLGDYWDQTEPADFDIANPLRNRFLTPIDQTIVHRLQELARIRGVSTESLVNLLLEQRLHEIEIS
jgi:hypothetical protein